LNPATEDTD